MLTGNWTKNEWVQPLQSVWLTLQLPKQSIILEGMLIIKNYVQAGMMAA